MPMPIVYEVHASSDACQLTTDLVLSFRFIHHTVMVIQPHTQRIETNSEEKKKTT